MTNDSNPRFAELLRRDAPAERDPVFRVEVLFRLERAKYRRRLSALLALGLVLAAIAAVGVGIGGAAREADAPRCASWEVDRAEFVPMDRAREIIHPDQLPFLDRLLELTAR